MDIQRWDRGKKIGLCLEDSLITRLRAARYGLEGDRFTWCNKREEPYTVRARLDRACSNAGGSDLFPLAFVSHEDVSCSDHSPIWISLDGVRPQDIKHKKRRFRFEAAWTSAPECKDVIAQAWSLPHKSLNDNIQATRQRLSHWDKESFGNIRWKLKQLDGKFAGN
ncbi:UNVERIFIED_CONTAM: hypothetical protein Slati_1403000 [Sesamum latifolium]|uniref:Uncharacterized protein n=1 Tax=Sesamum latifolium TaxID=2727402 RepID=A0AAW2X8K0_9LAMI